MKRLAVPAEVEAGGTVRMDIGVLEGRGQDSARDAADLTARFVVVALFTLLATVNVPGLSMQPAERGWTLLESCLHCIGTIAKVAIVFLIVGQMALRRLVPVGGSRVGMALGAAAGAMGGLLLVFICPFANTAHVVIGHAGGVVLAAITGAILMRLTARTAVALALLALLAVGCG